MAESVGDKKTYRFGLYEADVSSGELRKNGSKLRLQEQPFQVLVALLERPGEVITREELRQRLWPADTFVDFDHSLNTAINKLRDALGDTASNPRFIETLARRGYRFIAPVQAEASPETAVEPADATAPAEGPAAVGELPRARRGLVRLLFALIQVMYLIFYVVALARLEQMHDIAARALGIAAPILVIAVVSAVIGIPTRLYLLAAAAFDYKLLGQKFRRLFPLIFVMDELWALAALFTAPDIGMGLALAACAALLYVPFSQRTLMRMGYPDLAYRIPA